MKNNIVGQINELLRISASKLADWLEEKLPRESSNWWNDCVISNLSQLQKRHAEENGSSTLHQLDLAALLNVASKVWYSIYNTYSGIDCVNHMKIVRNVWAHCPEELPTKNEILRDLNYIYSFLHQFGCGSEILNKVVALQGMLHNADSTLSEKAVGCSSSEEKYFLNSKMPNARPHFFGREKECSEISACLTGFHRILFLEGIGGIGKSELAKRYALDNKDRYDTVVFLSYKDSLKTLVCDPMHLK